VLCGSARDGTAIVNGYGRKMEEDEVRAQMWEAHLWVLRQHRCHIISSCLGCLQEPAGDMPACVEGNGCQCMHPHHATYPRTHADHHCTCAHEPVLAVIHRYPLAAASAATVAQLM
jgi:hypothetical protein